MLRIQLVIARPEFVCTIPCIRSHNNFFRGVSIDKFTNCQVCYLVVAVMPVNTNSITQRAVMSGLVSVVGDCCSLSLCCDLYKGGKLFNGKRCASLLSVCFAADIDGMRLVSIPVTHN